MWMKIFTNKYFLIALFLIGGSVTVYFVGRHAGKLKGQGTTAKLPNNGKGIPVGWSPVGIATEVHKVLSDWFVSTTDKMVAFKSLLGLTDDQLIAVYNEFNRRFQGGKDKDTLYGWIDSEWFTGGPGLPDLAGQILQRFRNLKLT